MGVLRWAKRQIKCKTILLVFAVVILITGYHIYTQLSCSETISQEFVKNLCEQYHTKEAAGSLCSLLCDSKKLTYEQCTNYRGGKVVIFMLCDGCESGKVARVVLKSRPEVNFVAQHPPAPQSDSEKSMKDFLNLFQTIVRSYFGNEFQDNVTQHKDIVSYVWGWNFLKFIEESKLDKGGAALLAYKSVMSLLEQSEYLLSRYLHEKSYIPKIYGSCGNAYFVEYTEALNSFEFDFGVGASSTWKDRASMALKLLNLLKSLEQDFKQPVHLCDVKPANFGKGDYAKVTLIDTDTVFFDDQMNRQFLFSNCSEHSDCDFFDCRGVCDVNKGKCQPGRANNNMQSLCEDVFQGFSPKLPTGLLRDPPKQVEEDLYKALEECAYPDSHLERHSARQRASEATVNKLEEIIHLSLKYS